MTAVTRTTAARAARLDQMCADAVDLARAAITEADPGDVGAHLDDVGDPVRQASIVLDGLVARFGFPRGLILGASDGRVLVLASTGTTSLLARPVLGKVSDRIGRRRALLACFVFQAVALMTLAFAANLIALMIPGTLYMLGLAMASATTLAIAMEQAKPERRGRAMATFSIALPLSNGVGALICGGLVQWSGYFWMYLVLAGIATVGLIVTLANRAHLR